MAGLLCTDRREWDLVVVRDIFNARDQECILSTPVSNRFDVDKIYWRLESTGNYFVNSAYRFLQEQKGLGSAENNSSMWSKMWRIKGPTKVLKSGVESLYELFTYYGDAEAEASSNSRYMPSVSGRKRINFACTGNLSYCNTLLAINYSRHSTNFRRGIHGMTGSSSRRYESGPQSSCGYSLLDSLEGTQC